MSQANGKHAMTDGCKSVQIVEKNISGSIESVLIQLKLFQNSIQLQKENLNRLADELKFQKSWFPNPFYKEKIFQMKTGLSSTDHRIAGFRPLKKLSSQLSGLEKITTAKGTSNSSNDTAYKLFQTNTSDVLRKMHGG